MHNRRARRRHQLIQARIKQARQGH
jgi:hypothetical protein